MRTLIVVSGGDAPGINAAIDSYLRIARHNGDQVLGAQDGFAGLLAGCLVEIDTRVLALLAGRGGSILRSNRAPVLQQPDARQRLRRLLMQHAIDNLLLFGGDGTMQHVMPLIQSWDIPCIALPATIDNDVAGADYTLGHDSACNYAIQAVEGIRSTAQALPGRIFTLEILGGATGHLALAIARASGAHLALLPEYPIDLDWLARRLKQTVEEEGYALVVLSEGFPDLKKLLEELPRRTGIRLRHSSLGHAQRGADASHKDRLLAREMSHIAWRALRDGCQAGPILSRNGALALHEGSLPQGKKAPPDYRLYAEINQL